MRDKTQSGGGAEGAGNLFEERNYFASQNVTVVPAGTPQSHSPTQFGSGIKFRFCAARQFY